MPDMIKLKSSDGEVFVVEAAKIVKASTTIKNLLVCMAHEPGSEDQEFPLPMISAFIFKKIHEWIEYHKDDPAAEVDDIGAYVLRRSDDIIPWDANFFSVPPSTILNLIKAAHFLGIASLLDVGCKTVANLMRGKTSEQIRQEFNFMNDLEPEEQLQVSLENDWINHK